jgi:hypothetical protein
MKAILKILVGFVVVISSCTVQHIQAQGKFAGFMNGLIGTTYTDSRSIDGLENWQFRQGTLISPYDDPETITVDVFQKGPVYIIFFSVMEDTATHVYTIADVIEIKSMKAGWELKTAVCRQNREEDVTIVALVKPANAEYSTNVRMAWRFNRDKRRAEAIPVKGIDCLNEGFDQTAVPFQWKQLVVDTD